MKERAKVHIKLKIYSSLHESELWLKTVPNKILNT